MFALKNAGYEVQGFECAADILCKAEGEGTGAGIAGYHAPG